MLETILQKRVDGINDMQDKIAKETDADEIKRLEDEIKSQNILSIKFNE